MGNSKTNNLFALFSFFLKFLIEVLFHIGLINNHNSIPELIEFRPMPMVVKT
jgi:hypothetical protein